MSVDDSLKLVASSTIESLFSSNAVKAPISSFDLLTRVISTGSPPGLLPDSKPAPRFRHTDLSRFERIVEGLSECWELGNISILRDDGPEGGLTIMDVQLGVPSRGQTERPQATPMRRKRKRVVDEDDDSAVGRTQDQEAEESTPEKLEPWRPPPSTLESLSKSMKEVYTLMQQSTAKGKLLAEQVSGPLPLPTIACSSAACGTSSGHLWVASNRFVHISRRRNVQEPEWKVVFTIHRSRWPPSVTASTSVHSSGHTLTLPSATAPTSTHVTLSRPTHSRLQFRPYRLIDRYSMAHKVLVL